MPHTDTPYTFSQTRPSDHTQPTPSPQPLNPPHFHTCCLHSPQALHPATLSPSATPPHHPHAPTTAGQDVSSKTPLCVPVQIHPVLLVVGVSDTIPLLLLGFDADAQNWLLQLLPGCCRLWGDFCVCVLVGVCCVCSRHMHTSLIHIITHHPPHPTPFHFSLPLLPSTSPIHPPTHPQSTLSNCPPHNTHTPHTVYTSSSCWSDTNATSNSMR